MPFSYSDRCEQKARCKTTQSFFNGSTYKEHLLEVLAAVWKRVKMAVERGFPLAGRKIGCQEWSKT